MKHDFGHGNAKEIVGNSSYKKSYQLNSVRCTPRHAVTHSRIAIFGSLIPNLAASLKKA